MKKYYTLKINGYDQKCLQPFESLQAALLCLRCWTRDGRISGADFVEIITHIEITQAINSSDILGV